LLLLITFLASLFGGSVHSWNAFARVVVLTQLGLIAAPVLIMTVVLVRDARRTLLLTFPRPLALPAAAALAIVLHPAVMLLGQCFQTMYPMSEDMIEALEPMVKVLRETPLVPVLIIVALAPAICEELAFRGFILSGLRHLGSKWTAIVLSSLFFGVTHSLLQQSLAAAVLGVVLGYLAVQSGSLLPGVLYHATHNSLSVVAGRITPELIDRHSWLDWLFRPTSSETLSYVYSWPVVVAGGVVGIAILIWFRSLPYMRSREESLREAVVRYDRHHDLPS
jgi:sodium transport system permease protein